jgi:hypothetical protein
VITLLDSNVLIALLVPEHVHHEAAEVWLTNHDDSFATCPITQRSMIRLLIRQGHSAQETMGFLLEVMQDPRHVFWADDLSFSDVRMDRVLGHRQVTDAYLAQLARAKSGRLATFDRGLAAAHPDAVDLVPAG